MGSVGRTRDNGSVTSSPDPLDTPALRKERGAFFTPLPVVDFMTDWAIRSSDDSVFEPAAGDAEFLVSAIKKLKGLSEDPEGTPAVYGVEIHAASAEEGRRRVSTAGGEPHISHDDFFNIEPTPHSVVIGNPPYVRFQNWTGQSRLRSRGAALAAGVNLTALASSWAAFTIQSALFLQPGGRLALVLPGEMLSVNYAAPVRQFLFEKFRQVELVLFEELIFPGVEAEVVVLLADGYLEGPTDHAIIRQCRDASELADLEQGLKWKPDSPAGKWSAAGTLTNDARSALARAQRAGVISPLESWGDTTLGMVTGNNKYFTLSPQRAKDLGLQKKDLLRISPPGSAHLRGLRLTTKDLSRLGRAGQGTWLFSPGKSPSPAARSYIESGEETGANLGYKCRIRGTWWRVPTMPAPDLFLTAMNADTPRLTQNEANVPHLNSVYGVYLSCDSKNAGRELLAIASLNSLTMFHAEMVGRSYGGGILKLEPREADKWVVPSWATVTQRRDALLSVYDDVEASLKSGDLIGAVAKVDAALFEGSDVVSLADIQACRVAYIEMSERRKKRNSNGGR